MKNKINIKYILQVLKYITAQKKLLICWILTMLISTVVSAIMPFIDAKILTSITEFIPQEIIIFLLISLLIKIINSITSYFITILTEKVETDIILNLKNDFSKAIYQLEVKNFDKEGTGVFSERISREPGAVAGAIYHFRYIITELISSIGIYIYLFIISIEIALAVTLASTIMVIVDRRRTKIYKKHYEEMNELEEDRFSDFGEFIRGVRDIKVLNIKNYVLSKIYRDQKYIADKSITHMQKTKLFTNFSYLFNDIAKFLIILFGIYLILKGRLVATNLLVIYMYLNQAFYLGRTIANINDTLMRLSVSVSRLTEITDETKYSKEKFGSKKIKTLQGNIEFKNVNFEYEKNKQVLNNTSFNIEKNTTVGFVGESGQGKSTIFNLLSKLYQVNNKSIFIDDYDINELSEQSIRNNISVITQNPYIFNTSIKENLKMVNPNISGKKLNDIIKKCELDKYINSLEKGIDTKVGEGGVTLSGGQRQRLALARALVKKSNIILLDEATSALDNRTQKEIQKSIKEIGKNKTILIIAHRLSTIVKCDKIFVVDKGQIINSGTHNYLINNCEKYKELYQSEKN